jgi:hypothetical protein
MLSLKIPGLMERLRLKVEINSNKVMNWIYCKLGQEWMSKYGFATVCSLRVIGNVAGFMSGLFCNMPPRIYGASFGLVSNLGGVWSESPKEVKENYDESFICRVWKLIGHLRHPIRNFEFTQALLQIGMGGFYAISGLASKRPLEFTTGAAILCGSIFQSQIIGGDHNRNMRTAVKFFYLPSSVAWLGAAVMAGDWILISGAVFGLVAVGLQYLSNLNTQSLKRKINRLQKQVYAEIEEELTDFLPAMAVALGFRRFRVGFNPIMLTAPINRRAVSPSALFG